MKLLDKEGLEHYTGKVKGTLTNYYTKTETNTLLGNKENISNKVTSITSSSTDTQYPSAKCVYDSQATQDTKITNLENQVFGDETIEEENTSMTLDGTLKGQFNSIDLKGNTSQDGTPTPTSPIPVNVVNGDNEIFINGVNLVDLNELINISNVVSHTWVNDVLTVSNTAGTYRFAYVDITNLVKNNPGKILRLDYDSIDFSQSNARVVNLEIIDNGSTFYYTLVANNGDILTYTIPNNTSGITQVRLRFISNNSNTSQAGTIVITKPILHFGNTKIPYESYQGNTYNINLPIVNHFDLSNGEIGGIDSSGNLSVASDNWRATNYIPIKSNTTYTFSVTNYNLSNNYLLRIYEYDSNNNFISPRIVGATSTPLTFTTGANTKYIKYTMFINAIGTFTQDIINSIKPQIEPGPKANSYTPFGTTPIELCKIGNYQDYFYKDSGKWYLHKEVNKVNLDDYTFSLGSVTIGGISYSQYPSSTSSPAPILAGSYSTNLLSNYFIGKINDSSLPIEQQKNTIYVNSSRRIVVVAPELNGNYITTLEDFDAIKTNVVLYGIAYEPTNEEITYQPLIDQLNELEKAISYEGQSNISQVNNDLPFIISASAFLNNINGKIGLLNKLTEV